MAKIDIRDTSEAAIDEIIISDNLHIFSLIDTRKVSYLNHPSFFIPDDEYNVMIESKEHALNIIAALNKAIDLGWFKE